MTMPNLSEALWGWGVPVRFYVITKDVVDFEVQETEGAPAYGGGGFGGPYDDNGSLTGMFNGVLQPVPPRKLSQKPEGQRGWKWWTLWSTKELELDSVIVDGAGKRYRVMSQVDWNSVGGGYYEYEVTETFNQ